MGEQSITYKKSKNGQPVLDSINFIFTTCTGAHACSIMRVLCTENNVYSLYCYSFSLSLDVIISSSDAIGC